MSKSAYCSGCGRRIDLTEAGECPNGHLRSMLRDVREGAAPVAAPTRIGAAPGSSAAVGAVDREETAGKIIGVLVVAVPALIFAVVAVAITEPQFEGMGWPVGPSWLASLGTVAITLGGAAVWGLVRGKGRKR